LWIKGGMVFYLIYSARVYFLRRKLRKILDKMNILYVLYLPRNMPTISFRPYADNTGKFEVLTWLLERLSRRLAGRALLVMCHDQRDHELAARCSGESDAFVFRSPFTNKLEALADVAVGFDAAGIACFGVELAFAP